MMEKEPGIRLTDEIAAGKQLLESMAADSVEYRMVEQLNRSLADPEAAAARYFDYMELGREANRLIHELNTQAGRDQELINHYYVVVNVFYQSMVAHYHDISPCMDMSEAAKDRYLGAKDYQPATPEFVLDLEQVRAMMFGDREQRLKLASEHDCSEQRIIRLCEKTQTDMPDEIGAVFRIPLYSLASVHRNLSFGRFMVDDGPTAERRRQQNLS